MIFDCYNAVVEAYQELEHYKDECPSDVPEELMRVIKEWLEDHATEALNEIDPLQLFADE